MIYLQPRQIGLVLAEIRPPVERPQDLDTTIGQVAHSAGVIPQIIGYRRDAIDGWFLRVQPGDCEVAVQLLPTEPLSTRGIASDTVVATLDGVPDRIDLNGREWGGTASYTLAPISNGTVTYPIPNSDQVGWEFLGTFADGDRVDCFFAYDDGTGEGHGVRISRIGDNLIYAGLQTNVGAYIALTTIATTAYTGASEVGAAYYRNDDAGLRVWLRCGDRWWLPNGLFSTTTVDDGFPQLDITGAFIHDVTLFWAGVANCKYTVPEQYYGPLADVVGWVDGAWADHSERLRVAIETPELVNERMLRCKYAPAAIQALTINGVAGTGEGGQNFCFGPVPMSRSGSNSFPTGPGSTDGPACREAPAGAAHRQRDPRGLLRPT